MTGRIVVTVDATGTATAHTEGIHGKACLDYVEVLEDLLQARTVTSSYTADYTRGSDQVQQRAQQKVTDVDDA
jgi:hypothetical protein